MIIYHENCYFLLFVIICWLKTTRKCIDDTKKAHSFIQCSRIKSCLFKALVD